MFHSTINTTNQMQHQTDAIREHRNRNRTRNKNKPKSGFKADELNNNKRKQQLKQPWFRNSKSQFSKYKTKHWSSQQLSKICPMRSSRTADPKKRRGNKSGIGEATKIILMFLDENNLSGYFHHRIAMFSSPHSHMRVFDRKITNLDPGQCWCKSWSTKIHGERNHDSYWNQDDGTVFSHR